MSLPYRAKTVALFFLELGELEAIPITHMKLQKLIYVAHGWCLAIHGKPLIEESIEAWRYGPMIGNVYQWLKHFGSDPIQLSDLDASDNHKRRLAELKQDTSTVELLERVWQVHKNFDDIKLSGMTHLPTSPWAQVREKTPETKFNITIDDSLIRDYFVAHAKR
jgi:uncharacterized phage-associated protein